MAQTTKATRQNRTITVDFQDPSLWSVKIGSPCCARDSSPSVT